MSDIAYSSVDGGIVAPAGFLAAGIAAGIKKSGKRDVCVIACERAVPAAAVFTLSSMAAAPVVLSRSAVAGGAVRAVVVNSGNANACTGASGVADAHAMAASVAEEIGCDPTQVVVASTGVIGLPMPMSVVLPGIADAVASLDNASGDAAAEAIMTTDTFRKQLAVRFTAGGRDFTVGGMAKGSGMIMPNMATMLGFITTDAPLSVAACNAILRPSADRTFNRITVDGDTSTNDMVLLMASGAEGGPLIDVDDPLVPEVRAAIETVCGELARMIVRDGEGATKFITVTVRGAAGADDARDAAMSIANSPLFKTAIFGGDANWGRVAMAVGKSRAKVDPDRLEVVFAGITTCRDGMAVDFDEAAAAVALSSDEIEVVADLHLGDAESTVWTCDLSYEYVRINGEYRT